MSYKKWVIANADKEKASVISEKLNIDPLVAFLLVSRGFDDELSAQGFLSSSSAYSSPYSLKDMDKAVSRINTALDMGENICIYGDYDCDGVTATSLLYTFLEDLGANVIYYIPDRLSEGYGMNKSAIDYIKQQGTNLIVTVDNGISSFDEAEYIYSLGMELIVTDHHQIGEKLPRAEAVINPHREDNNIRFRDFAGVGVAFKLACALYDGDIEDILAMFGDLVAIGTIGDVVPLKDENRNLVKLGIKLINDNSRIGLEALRKSAGNADSILTAGDVAFQICPRINAAGRMDNASKAVELLTCEDYERARLLADQLNIENTHRHEVESNILDDIKELVSNSPSLVSDRVIVIDGSGYHHGVIGIVASHIVGMYSKPAIVIGVEDNGEGTGSARSVEGFNIYDAISYCSDLLTHFGGHPLAAGLGIKKEDIPEFRRRINEYAKNNYPVMPVEALRLDCKISPFYLDVNLVDNLEVLEPYGAENPQAIFGLFNMTVSAVNPIGDGKHIRLDVTKKGKTFRVVKFKTSVDDFPFSVGDNIDLAVKISKNLYKGNYYLSIHAVDYRKNGMDYDRFFEEKSDYELFKIGNKNKTDLYPNREICSVIYKYLKKNNGYNHSVEDLYFALNQDVTYGALCFALDAFCEAGLITMDNSIKLNKTSGKVDLEATNVLTTLKGRI